jgi:hypothetical protein
MATDSGCGCPYCTAEYRCVLVVKARAFFQLLLKRLGGAKVIAIPAIFRRRVFSAELHAVDCCSKNLGRKLVDGAVICPARSFSRSPKEAEVEF